MLDKVIKKGLERADEAEAYLADREVITIRMADKRILEAKGVNERSLAVRLVKDKKISIANTSLLDDKHIDRCLDNPITIDDKHEEWKGFPSTNSIKPFNGYDKALADLSIDEFTSIAEEIIDKALAYNIDNLSGSLHLIKEEISLANSNSLSLNDKATYIITSITADKGKGSGIGFNASRKFDSFKPLDAVENAISMAINSSNPKRCEEGEYSIIFEPYAFGELLSFVFAYNFNGKMYRDKRSCLYGRLREKVAVDNFSLYDEPRIEDGLGSKPFDDEGIETRTNRLIDNGIFNDIIYDLFYAYKDNRDSTGNGLRLGYPIGRTADMPIPSMHNIVVKEGDYDKEEMIKDTKKGLLVGRLWYTYPVNPEQGDFSCTARSGIFLIENGEIKHPCNMVRIIDNLKKLMLKISAISKDREQVLQWHATPCITPTIRVDGIKIVPVG
ncbi:MAG: TldD/PmbA family protein [Candidatus Nitrosothermus koennekii]|nr:MAG: TldD/PmbA family protein [Candidatus Nitrosothermus koennekii]